MEVTNLPAEPAVSSNQNQVLKKPFFLSRIFFIIIGFLALALLIGGYFLLNKKATDQSISQPSALPATGGFLASSQPQSSAILYDNSDPEIAKYDKDSDGNAIPDFVEEALGYDPLIDDCARDTGCEFGDTGKYTKKPDNTLLILDSSGSMGLKLGNETRMTIAKSVIKEWISNFDENQNVGLMVYGHKGSNSSADKTLSCAGIEILYPLASIDKQKFNTAVDSFQATGWTPIAASLVKAKDEVFVGNESENNRIILVSDGEEMCGGNPGQTAKLLKDSNINVVIDVIGFSADGNAKSQLQEVARLGGGTYYEANTKDEFQKAFKQWWNNFFLLVDENVCIVNNYNEWLICLGSMQHGVLGKYEGKGVINNYLTPRCSQLQKEGKTQEYQKCMETIKKITSRYLQLVKQIDDEKMQRYKQNLEDIEKNKQENNPANN